MKKFFAMLPFWTAGPTGPTCASPASLRGDFFFLSDRCNGLGVKIGVGEFPEKLWQLAKELIVPTKLAVCCKEILEKMEVCKVDDVWFFGGVRQGSQGLMFRNTAVPLSITCVWSITLEQLSGSSLDHHEIKKIHKSIMPQSIITMNI